MLPQILRIPRTRLWAGSCGDSISSGWQPAAPRRKRAHRKASRAAAQHTKQRLLLLRPLPPWAEQNRCMRQTERTSSAGHHAADVKDEHQRRPSVAQQFLQLQRQSEVVTARVEQLQDSKRVSSLKRVKHEESVASKANLVSALEQAEGVLR